MKYIASLLTVFLLWSCQKEDELTNRIDFTNIYAITDDPNNPVQQERYKIYQEYGVSVYFNDTINQAYVRDDIYGNPVFRYETIDPQWVFFNDAEQTVSGSFKYAYTQGEERQLRVLARIRKFCEKTSKALRPTLLFTADTIWSINGTDTTSWNYRNNFRLLLWSDLADITDIAFEQQLASIQRTSLSTKISTYTAQLQEFGKLSEGTYGSVTGFLGALPTGNVTIGKTNRGANMLFYGRMEAMFYTYDEYFSFLRNNQFPEASWGAYVTDEDIDAFIEKSRVAFTQVVGPKGFVSYSTNLSAVFDAEADLQDFVKLMLMYSSEDFIRYWGAYPIVMQKYNILYDLIVNKLGVEL